MIKQTLTAVLASAALVACSTPGPTLYAPARAPQAMGYSEFRLEPGRYRITFRGGPGAPPDQVADYALLRAADLAIADGYDWFRVYDRRMEGQPGNGPRVSLGVGGASFGSHSAVGLGVSRGFDLSGGPQLTSTLEVIMGKGPAPSDPQVYVARDVRRTVGPRAS